MGTRSARALLRWLLGDSLASGLGGALMIVGALLVVYSAGAYVGIFPGGYASVPQPVALAGATERSARLEVSTAQPSAAPTATLPAPTAAPTVRPTASLPTATPAPLVVLKGEPADAEERRQAVLSPRPGPPVRLAIPSIEVETDVQPAGVVTGRDGQLEWETLPFVAATYPQLGPVGAPGNPVISGHVVTLYEGNVFRNLYQVKLGEQVDVYTGDSHFTYVVEEVKLVEPSDVSVMQPSEDARLTLITCGGTFDPRSQTFSDRLIVVGRLIGGERR